MADDKLRMPKNKFLIRRVGVDEVSPGGIEIPKTAQKRIPRGIVIEAGIHDDLGVEVEVGDTLAFAKYDGTVVEIGGETLLILGVKEVLLVVKK